MPELSLSAQRLVRSLEIERPGQIAIWSSEAPQPPPGSIWIETLYSGLSAGTELTFFKGSNPYLQSSWNQELCVFDQGEPETRFPIRDFGYMEVGRVAQSRTSTVHEGEILAMAYGHKTGHCADPLREFFMPVPSDLDPILGIYIAQMGPICANGLLHAAADLVGQDVRDLGDGVRGRAVLVVGAGVVGLLTGLLALHHGAAEVAVSDRTASRLRASQALGMAPIDENEVEVWRYCKERWRHGAADRGADVVFQCRAQPASLQAALRSLRPQGVVIDLAFYQDGADAVRLGEEFHHNGLTIRCAQIGRVPRGLQHSWDRARLARETIELLRAKGGLIREHLITDIVDFEEAPGLIADLAARRRHTIQAVFRVSS